MPDRKFREYFQEILKKHFVSISGQEGTREFVIIVPKPGTAAVLISQYAVQAVAPFDSAKAQTFKEKMFEELGAINKLSGIPFALRAPILGLVFGTMSFHYNSVPTGSTSSKSTFVEFFHNTFGQAADAERPTVLKNQRVRGLDTPDEQGGRHYRRMANILMAVGLALHILPDEREFESATHISNPVGHFTVLLYKAVSHLSFLLAKLPSRNLFERLTIMDFAAEINNKVSSIRDDGSELFSIQHMMRNLAEEANNGLEMLNNAEFVAPLKVDMKLFPSTLAEKEKEIADLKKKLEAAEENTKAVKQQVTSLEGRLTTEKELLRALRTDLDAFKKSQQESGTRRDRDVDNNSADNSNNNNNTNKGNNNNNKGGKHWSKN
jgi:hypothetical protein